MSNLTQRGPLGLKLRKAPPEPEHLKRVRALPCCICAAFGEVQLSPTTAHHCIHDRYSGERVPDREAIPLCDGHHQGLWDTTKLAIHNDKTAWRAKYGSDRNYIAHTLEQIDEETQ